MAVKNGRVEKLRGKLYIFIHNSGGLESGGHLWGSRVWESTGLGPPILDPAIHILVV